MRESGVPKLEIRNINDIARQTKTNRESKIWCDLTHSACLVVIKPWTIFVLIFVMRYKKTNKLTSRMECDWKLQTTVIRSLHQNNRKNDIHIGYVWPKKKTLVSENRKPFRDMTVMSTCKPQPHEHCNQHLVCVLSCYFTNEWGTKKRGVSLPQEY